MFCSPPVSVIKVLLLLRYPLSRLQQDRAVFTAVWWWWGKGSIHWGEPPLLYICLDEDEAQLAEVDVDSTGSVCTEGGEEIEALEPMGNIVEFLSIAGEEYGAAAGTVADAYHIALDVGGAVVSARERLIVSSVTSGGVGKGMFMPSCVTTSAPLGKEGGYEHPPGNRNMGYGFVVIPIDTSVDSGLS